MCAGGRDFCYIIIIFIIIQLLYLYYVYCISIFYTLNQVCCVKLGQVYIFYFLQRRYRHGLSWLWPQPRLVFVVSTSAHVQPPHILLPTCLPIEPVALTTDRQLCLQRFPWRRDRKGFPPPSFTITCECKIKFIWHQSKCVCYPVCLGLALCCRFLVDSCFWFKLKCKQMHFFTAIIYSVNHN